MTDVKTIAAGWEPSRVSALRDVMSTMKLDALVIPRWDEQQFEYVSLANERLAWTTGFTGSWGLSIVTHDDVILFIDGRYPEQAARETNSDWVTLQHLYEEPPEDWLSQHAQAGWRVGFDSEVVTPTYTIACKKSVSKKQRLCSRLPQTRLISVGSIDPRRLRRKSFSCRLSGLVNRSLRS